jgi:hypothetical protein
MPTSPEVNLVQKHWPWLLALIAALVALEFVALHSSPQTPRRWADYAWPVIAAVVPNFIAGLLAGAVLHWLSGNQYRATYVTGMRAIREAVANHRHSNGIAPESVQTLMARVVPEVAQLYFGSDQPPDLSRKQLAKVPKTAPCSTCGLDSEPKSGRCTKCNDTFDTWRVMEAGSQNSPVGSKR